VRDRDYLRLALRLARRGRGDTAPNPLVGAIVVRGGRIVGRGYHRRAGGPHAEVVALGRAGERARGARLFVNLEPCCHHGRTPPCVDAIVGAGVREVIASMRDPDPRVNGKGFRALRAAGVRVRVGLMAGEARALNREFRRSIRSGLPLVTLKAGMSLDGRIATWSGRSRWITSSRSRAAARALRRRHDAVLVGVNTVLADDPRLTAEPRRSRAPHAPARVVLDARLRTPPAARCLDGAGGEAIILTLRGAPKTRRARLERAGALVVEVAGRAGRVDLRSALAELAHRGIRSVLIEGGSETLGSALDGRLGNRLTLFVAGTILGGRGALPVFGGHGAGRLGEAARLRQVVVRPLGRDFLVEGRLEYPRRARGGA
jgi:diaminohydroxyphosphoribosylaminopyrimidine deaminase/5-amino-6-(5-phosphoribosylamino)uracil reductase